jgi:hypothetical protein
VQLATVFVVMLAVDTSIVVSKSKLFPALPVLGEVPCTNTF